MGATYPGELDPFEWGRWFRGLSDDEATDIASQLLTRLKHDTRCFMDDHAGQLDGMRVEIVRLQRINNRYRDALTFIRSETQKGLRGRE